MPRGVDLPASIRERKGDMNKREACAWVHAHLLVDSMAHDELLAAFTVLAGHAPTQADRTSGLFRRCGEMVMTATGVPARFHANTIPPARRRPS
jgi:hypothetical protein